MSPYENELHAFDVDERAGFMPPSPPLTRLPQLWELWETILDAAIHAKLQLGGKVGLAVEEAEASEAWRVRVRQLPVIPICELDSPMLLRRAHLVLTYILHFYIHTLPLTSPICIPKPISLPLVRISQKLDIPPLLTFSDTVLYNWVICTSEDFPTPLNVRSQTLFTGLRDEEEFYLCSARIELRGVEALQLVRATMDETSVNDSIAVRHVTQYLSTLSSVIDELRALMNDVRNGCDPDTYYNQVRPWFCGEDSDANKRKWVYEGLAEEGLLVPEELSGPSAGQSSLIHALDSFLGVNHGNPSFMQRMQSYMPRKHRLFLDHLMKSPRPLREFVVGARDGELEGAYNRAVGALKKFRDAHMIIAHLYILGPARRAASLRNSKGLQGEGKGREPVKGTGGTDLVTFLKDTRTRTIEAVIP